MLDSESDFKVSIENIVAAYKMQYPEEYELLCDAVEMQRKLLHDPKYGKSIGADKDSDQRALYEISITLSDNLTNYLSIDALTWLKSKKGGHWFATAFKEFALPQDI